VFKVVLQPDIRGSYITATLPYWDNMLRSQPQMYANKPIWLPRHMYWQPQSRNLSLGSVGILTGPTQHTIQ